MLGSADRSVCEAHGPALPGAYDQVQRADRARPAAAPRPVTILVRLVDLWPQTLLALGVVLTIAWSGVLLWWLIAVIGLV
jgi:hypothetical protein